MSTLTQVYVGAPTPFGIITTVERHLFNPRCTIKAGDGSETVRHLGQLQALGVRPLPQGEEA